MSISRECAQDTHDECNRWGPEFEAAPCLCDCHWPAARTTWSYAFAREHLDDGSNHFTLREVYVSADGGLSWSKPVSPTGDTIIEIGDTLARMGSAMGRPVLDLTLDPPEKVSFASMVRERRPR